MENQRYGRIDPRQVTKFLRQPGFAQTVGQERVAGMEKRVMQAKWQVNERIVYDAVQDGYTSMDSLPVATGLSEADIRSAVTKLVGRGAISSIDVREATPAQM